MSQTPTVAHLKDQTTAEQFTITINDQPHTYPNNKDGKRQAILDGLHAIGFTVTPDEKGLEERYYVDAPEPRRGMLKLWEMKRGGIASARFASPKSVV